MMFYLSAIKIKLDRNKYSRLIKIEEKPFLGLAPIRFNNLECLFPHPIINYSGRSTSYFPISAIISPLAFRVMR